MVTEGLSLSVSRDLRDHRIFGVTPGGTAASHAAAPKSAPFRRSEASVENRSTPPRPRTRRLESAQLGFYLGKSVVGFLIANGVAIPMAIAPTIRIQDITKAIVSFTTELPAAAPS
jgi:hypothetical protein